MARIKQTQRKNTGGWAPRKCTSVKEPRNKSAADTSLHLHDTAAPSAPHPADTVGLSGGSNFNWDLIEVSIDAEVLDPGTIWLLMINVKPNPVIAYAWHQFDLDDLKEELESETGIALDTEQYDLSYGNEHSTFAFNRTGGYHIALKRFAEAGGAVNNILSLQIQARKSKVFQGVDPKEKERGPRSTGADSDFSDDRFEQEAPQQKRRRTGRTPPAM